MHALDGRSGGAIVGVMSLGLSLWVDRSSLRPDREGRCSLAVDLAATGSAAIEGRRPAARTILALDVSASMEGEPLAHVIRSVDRLLDALREEDEVGIVAFSENASRVVEPVRVDAPGKRLVRSRVARLFAESGTNIEAGLERAAEMLEGTPAGMRRGVVLLSDGAPNVGAHTADALREVVRRHRAGVSFFALGYGVDHSEDVLSAIGEAGGGGYEYVPDPAACVRSFARALGTQGDVVASEVELVVSPAEGVEIVRFVGREESRFSREGVVVSLPDMVNGARRLVVAELRVRRLGGTSSSRASWRSRRAGALPRRRRPRRCAKRSCSRFREWWSAPWSACPTRTPENRSRRSWWWPPAPASTKT